MCRHFENGKMTLENTQSDIQKPYLATFKRKRQFAFATTSMAMFCLLCFVASLGINQFETNSSIEISSVHSVSPTLVQQLIDAELSDEKLADHLVATQRNSDYLENEDIVNQRMDSIRKSFSFSSAERVEGGQYRLTARYHGKGSSDEKHLTHHVVRGIAQRLSGLDNLVHSAEKVEQQFEIVKRLIESNASRLNQELDGASRLVDNLNLGLSNVHEAVELLGPDDRINSKFNQENNIAIDGSDRQKIGTLLGELQQSLSSIEAADDEREIYDLSKSISRINDQLQDLGVSDPDNSNSMRIINAALPETNTAVRSILELLAVCDTDSIQTQIGQVQNNLRTDSIKLREDVTSMKLLADNLSESRYVVNSISQPSTKPSSSKSIFGYVLTIALISGLFGTVIASHYRPDLENCGFEDSESVSDILGVPVIATVSESEPDEENQSAPNYVVNSIVSYSEVVLFGFILMTLMLCVVQPDLRQAFFESPVYGLSRMSSIIFSL